MGCYLHYVLADELAWWLRIFLMLMLLFLTSTLLAYVIYLLTVLIVEIRVKLEHLSQERERTLETRLTRRKTAAELNEALAKAQCAKRDAEFTYITARQDEAVFIRDDNRNAVWQPLHLIAHRQLGSVIVSTS